ncbi:MAG: anti-sigma factor [Phycisphaerales bacterium]|nr:anti-sigma factor [Phycisphaerales bacterium]
MTNLDCKDIKAMLSGLVDDEVDRDTRHAAERHLADCPGCRELVNEAESINQMLAMEAERALSPAGLPAGFAEAVLGQTVYAEAYNFAGRRWTSWLGWVAAAACLLLSLSIWVLNQGGGSLIAGGPRGADPLPPGLQGTRGSSHLTRSWTFDGPLPGASAQDEQTNAAIDEQLARYQPAALEVDFSSQNLSQDDADTLYAASNLLTMLSRADASSFADAERVRQIAEYDEILERLESVRERLSAQDRAVVLAAESVLLRIVNGPLSLGDLTMLRETVKSLELAAHVQAISDRWFAAASL